MAMTLDWPRSPGLTWPAKITLPFRPRPKLDAALRAVLAKKDDRLLADVGLSRDDVLGPEAAFRAEWARTREPWML